MWNKIVDFFQDSETIFWARVQSLFGLVIGALTYVDPQLVTALLQPEYVPIFLLANGAATEYLRRRRANDL